MLFKWCLEVTLTWICYICEYTKLTLCCRVEIVNALNLNRDQLYFCMFLLARKLWYQRVPDPNVHFLHRLPETDCSKGTFYGSNESKSGIALHTCSCPLPYPINSALVSTGSGNVLRRRQTQRQKDFQGFLSGLKDEWVTEEYRITIIWFMKSFISSYRFPEKVQTIEPPHLSTQWA